MYSPNFILNSIYATVGNSGHPWPYALLFVTTHCTLQLAIERFVGVVCASKAYLYLDVTLAPDDRIETFPCPNIGVCVVFACVLFVQFAVSMN